MTTPIRQAHYEPIAGTAHATYLNTKYFGSLDGVRCLSILAVIWHHSPHPSEISPLLLRGFLGVDMFFVLSGFLIVTLLLRERKRAGSIDLKKFYIRRSIRIMPIYYLLLAVVAVIMLTVKARSKMAESFWHDLPYLATYTSNWVPITAVNLALVWSLATEEQFYLIWPSVERYLKPRAVFAILAVVLVVNQLLNFGFFEPLLVKLYGESKFRPNIIAVTFTPIALGVLLAHMLNRERSFMALYRFFGSRVSPLILGPALVMVCAWAPPDISGLPRVFIQVLMTVLLASLVMREDHLVRPILSFRPIARLGAISYGMYLYHEWAMYPLHKGYGGAWTRNPIVFFAVAVVATVIVSELSFRFIETPLLKWKQRFSH